ncbi:endonuclease [Nocardioides sp. IC4_145]|uniref:endonuclease n=1 Tax=Nocardioides sp. IC4_145 TaxID=2714037 RepID=UPI00140E0567|nr:endonuclease [Nocardioides sp. IC4_145]NHC25086.1 endonuclease [Nocardioides sp. IC4_145]
MSHRDIARALLEQHGTTYAEDAGIRIDDKPAALWQLLVLSLLLSARISSGIAVAAARELFDAGCTTPERTRDAQRRSLIAAFGRSGYRRYDERTSTQLHGLAAKVLDDFSGDLRRMHERCDGVPALEDALQEFTGIGPAGAAIFLREVQGVWPDVAPYVDELAAKGADRLGLPTDPEKLADLVPPEDLPRLVAACVRAARDKDVVEGVREA